VGKLHHAYELESEFVDGMDVMAMREATQRAVERARKESLPTLIEARTYRYMGHSMSDPGKYRTRAEIEKYQERDPIKLFKARLEENGMLTDDDVAAMEAEVREQVEHAVTQHRLEIAIGEDVPVRLDPRLTAGALAHLIENAAQYSPPGSAIHITTTLAGQELAIRVRDHGPGLAASDLPRVFDRFFRGTASSANGSGTGMGLSIARGLLAAEHARVWAENATGGGAAFTIAVPVEVKEAMAHSPTA